MSADEKLSRRRFLRNAAAGVAGVAAGIATAPAFGSTRFQANDRIQMCVIGCGGMGTGHLQHLVDMSKDPNNGVAVVGVCDVYDARKQRAGDISKAKVHHEYEEALARDDVDAVVIATPDHWHAQIALDALNAGKDVYLEKPMTHTWQQAKEVWETVLRTGRVLQVGAQGTSEDKWWRANNWIRTGQIGKLLWSKTSYSRNSTGGEWNWHIDEGAGPHNIDWKRWLGPAPWRPFSAERYFRFRKYWDYSGGIATDLFYHQLAHMLIATGSEFPKFVTATGGIYVQHDREVPDTFHMMIDYPSEHTILLCSSMANRVGVEETIHGHEATLYFEGDGFRRVPEEEFRDKHQEIKVNERPREGHMENFLNCVRTRQRPHCDAEHGFKTMVAIHLGVLAYRNRRTMEFDPENLHVVEPVMPAPARPPFG